jgi:hypothetical protein
MTLATVLEARQSPDQEAVAMLRDHFGVHVEPWTFEVRVSEEDEHAMVVGLVDLVIKNPKSASVIHAIRKSSCPQLLYAAERLLERKPIFDAQEIEMLVYLFLDIRECYRDTIKNLLSSEAARKVMNQATSSPKEAIQREAIKIQEWLSS